MTRLATGGILELAPNEPGCRGQLNADSMPRTSGSQWRTSSADRKRLPNWADRADPDGNPILVDQHMSRSGVWRSGTSGGLGGSGLRGGAARAQVVGLPMRSWLASQRALARSCRTDRALSLARPWNRRSQGRSYRRLASLVAVPKHKPTRPALMRMRSSRDH